MLDYSSNMSVSSYCYQSLHIQADADVQTAAGKSDYLWQV